MKTSPLLVASALLLASGNLVAYQIVESRFHVEVAPNKFVDQLVLRCEDGRQVTVPWQSKLAESCGEDLMGNVTLPPASAAPIDEQQKQAMLEQLRSQYGNISEKQVEFISGPAGISTRFKPPIVEVLKKYESCRKALKDKAYCAAERDKALARLADPKPTSVAARTPEATESPSRQPGVPASIPETAAAPTPSPNPGSTPKEATVPPSASSASSPASSEAAPQPTQTAAVAATPAEPPPAPPSEQEVRGAAEQKINQDYMTCLRAKPKYDCDQARTKALTALDKPKSQKQRKPASKPVEPQAQR